jgi:hypothetical protein
MKGSGQKGAVNGVDFDQFERGKHDGPNVAATRKEEERVDAALDWAEGDLEDERIRKEQRMITKEDAYLPGDAPSSTETAEDESSAEEVEESWDYDVSDTDSDD